MKNPPLPLSQRTSTDLACKLSMEQLMLACAATPERRKEALEVIGEIRAELGRRAGCVSV